MTVVWQCVKKKRKDFRDPCQWLEHPTSITEVIDLIPTSWSSVIFSVVSCQATITTTRVMYMNNAVAIRSSAFNLIINVYFTKIPLLTYSLLLRQHSFFLAKLFVPGLSLVSLMTPVVVLQIAGSAMIRLHLQKVYDTESKKKTQQLLFFHFIYHEIYWVFKIYASLNIRDKTMILRIKKYKICNRMRV